MPDQTGQNEYGAIEINWPNELRTKLSQSIIRGDRIDRTIDDLTERMNVSRSNAVRLIQTETAFFTGQATAAGYKASGVVDRYEILATLDSRTTFICRGLDGKEFKLAEKEVSVNYPPFHVRCRTTTVSYFDDEIGLSERIARGADGKTCYVPGDMTYQAWYQKHVVERYGQEKVELMEKKIANEANDRELHEKYRSLLGSDVPRSFADFQELKYNKTDEWNEVKAFYYQKNNGWIPDGMKLSAWSNNLKGIKWTAVDFAPKKLRDHYDKHSQDFGAISEKGYSTIARDLLNSKIGGDIDGFTTKQGYVFRYDKKKNIFAIGKPDGVIATCYKPEKGLEYWEGEKKKYEH